MPRSALGGTARPVGFCAAIRGYIDDYNSLRPHEALDYATPDEVYKTCFSVNGAA